MIIIFLFFLVFFVVYYVVRDKKGEYHSHWNTLIPLFEYPPKKFYKQLSEKIAESNIESLYTQVVTEKEGNAFSASRLYLKISWKEYNYYMCVAPFGDGVFMSSYLFYKQRKRELIVNAIPFVGPLVLKKLFPVTMYRIDSASMYMTYCHDAMTKVIDEITKETGFRLSENDRKPTIKNVFKR